MILELLNPEVSAFILAHEHADINELLLKGKTIHGIPTTIIADQIRGRRKAKEKLPSFYKNTQIIYPPGVNLEQSSSEQAAKFKLSLVQKLLGNEMKQGADLTGGFGIDAYFLSSIFNQYHFIEPNPNLITIARHNHQSFSAKNIAYENMFADAFLETFVGDLDLVYIDPSRRTTNNQKVCTLADCEPDVMSLQDHILKKSAHFIVKTSPLLDIQLAITQLKGVKKVVVLSIGNECKELLFFCERAFSSEPTIEAVNLSDRDGNDVFEFVFSEEKNGHANLAKPRAYLYEPNASILKAGAFKTVSNRFGIDKLHSSTHLYTSDSFVENFPGRIFKVVSLVKPDPKILKNFFPEGKANITTRNYPLSVEDLRKKTRLKDGGEKYLIGFTDIDSKMLAVAERLK